MQNERPSFFTELYPLVLKSNGKSGTVKHGSAFLTFDLKIPTIKNWEIMKAVDFSRLHFKREVRPPDGIQCIRFLDTIGNNPAVLNTCTAQTHHKLAFIDLGKKVTTA